MHGTDEVGVAGVQDATIAFGDFGHGGRIGFWFGFSLRELGVGSDRTRLDTPVLHPHQGYLFLVSEERKFKLLRSTGYSLLLQAAPQ